MILLLSAVFLLIITLVLFTIYNHVKVTSAVKLPSQQRAAASISCDVLPIDKLTKCDPTNQQACKNCSMGNYSCYTVTKDKPYKFQSDTSSEPVNIPEGNWCLPVQVSKVPCNNYTGIPILTKESADSPNWIWRCHCSNPDLFSSEGVSGDCIYQKACGYPEGKVICPLDAPSSICKQGEEWTHTSRWSPFLGTCGCPSGKKALVKKDEQGKLRMTCVEDTCAPGTANTANTSCTCPAPIKNDNGEWTSYIRCPDDISGEAIHTSIYQGECLHSPQCWADPCNPYGYYDSKTKKCICNDPPYKNRSYIQSITGCICNDPCSVANNPCGKGDSKRGDCKIDDNGRAYCKCNNKYANQSKTDTLCLEKLLAEGVSCSKDSDCWINLKCKKHPDPYAVWKTTHYCS